jgi:hypothetical protein
LYFSLKESYWLIALIPFELFNLFDKNYNDSKHDSNKIMNKVYTFIDSFI